MHFAVTTQQQRNQLTVCTHTQTFCQRSHPLNTTHIHHRIHVCVSMCWCVGILHMFANIYFAFINSLAGSECTHTHICIYSIHICNCCCTCNSAILQCKTKAIFAKRSLRWAFRSCAVPCRTTFTMQQRKIITIVNLEEKKTQKEKRNLKLWNRRNPSRIRRVCL